MRKKCAAICQTIVAACQPRSYISPPLLALATFIHKKYGSREMTDILTSHVLAESYNEVVMVINAQMRELFSHADSVEALRNLSSTMMLSTLPLQ